MNYRPRVITLIISINVLSCRAAAPISNKPTRQIGFEETENLDITICLGYEPRYLYPYQANSQATQEVFQTICDKPLDIFSSDQMELSTFNN
jgi:hypothetical protein